MFKEVFDYIFRLPPVEKRQNIQDAVVVRLVNPVPLAEEKDDAYIYYQLAKTALMTMGVLAFPFLMAYVLKKSLFGIYVPEYRALYAILAQYANAGRFVLTYVALPFFLLKLRINLNPKSYDVLWFSPGFPPARPRKRWKILCVAILIFLIFFTCFLFIDVLPLWMFGFLYGENVFSLGLYMMITSYFSTLCLMFMFLALIWCWRYIGKYQGN